MPAFVLAEHVPGSSISAYPQELAKRVKGRTRRRLGEVFGLRNFGVNLTSLAPGSMSALRHAHTKEDEFLYILEGEPTLQTNRGRFQLTPGTCAGFLAATGDAHHLINETNETVLYLEIGDRTPGDEAFFPDDDLKAVFLDGKWTFLRLDGTSY
jgi:uncharacterized cupin superfamily protein